MSQNKKTFQTIMRRVKQIMLTIISILLAVMFVLVALLQFWSIPGKPKPYLDETGNVLPNSLSEKVFININGIEQGMFIKSRDASNPVLLYLHGGMPDYFLTEKYPTGLEEYFTVVWWEQRGSGISYSSSIPPESLNREQMISDTFEVTQYLRQRFGREKIYLMGHSGGTFIAIQAAARKPELYYAYIGVAQMSHQLLSEKMAYDYMLERFKENGDTRMVQKLEAAPVTLEGGTPYAYRVLRDPAMHSLGIGTMHSMDSVVTGIFLPSWQSRDYTLMEKIHTWSAKANSGIASLWDDMLTTDLSQQVTEFSIPVYFFEGKYDYTVNTSLAKDYFQKIQAPVKGLYIFEQSAHSPIFEEPEKAQKIIREDILTGTNTLAGIK